MAWKWQKLRISIFGSVWRSLGKWPHLGRVNFAWPYIFYSSAPCLLFLTSYTSLGLVIFLNLLQMYTSLSLVYTFLGVFGPLLDRRRPLVGHKLWAEWGPGRTTCALGTFLLRLKSTLQQLYYALPFPVITKSTYSRLPEHGLTKMTSKLNLQEV